MKLSLLTLIGLLVFSFSAAQNNPEDTNLSTILAKERNFSIGGYGQIDYNQTINSTSINNGNLDVHRLVLLFKYQFDSKTKLVTEIEYEHVKEVYVEQVYVNHKINSKLNLRGGLLLIPMGIINEYHEPPTFNGVERPNVDKYIVPTTWREIGIGINGRFNEQSLKYQLYLVNGFNGYNDGSAKLNGENGLRGGRQKGAKSIINKPNFTGKIEYYGLKNLKVGFSGYFGKTQSSLYKNIDKSEENLIKEADSTVVGVSMLGVDIRYRFKGIQFKGQYNYSKIGNALEYNEFTGSDLGDQMFGYYTELAYNVFESTNISKELIGFVRYEHYDTHDKVNEQLTKNTNYNRKEIIAGLGYRLTNEVSIKSDIQFSKPKSIDNWNKTLNLGIGFEF